MEETKDLRIIESYPQDFAQLCALSEHLVGTKRQHIASRETVRWTIIILTMYFLDHKNKINSG